MRQHWHVAGGDEIEHRFGEARRCDPDGDARPAVWLSGRNLPRVDVLPFVEASAYDILWAEHVVVEEAALQRHHALLDPGGVILVEPRIDVRRARGDANAVGHRDARHFERRRLVGRTVVDPRQHVAVEVDMMPRAGWTLAVACPTTGGASPTPGEHDARERREHIALEGMWRAKSKHAVQDHRQQRRTGGDCSTVKLRAVSRCEAAYAHHVPGEPQRDDHRRRSPIP